MAQPRHYILKAEPGIIGLQEGKAAFPDMKMRCGGCGHTGFIIVVRPHSEMARAIGFKCMKCDKSFLITHEGFVDGTGQVTYDGKVN